MAPSKPRDSACEKACRDRAPCDSSGNCGRDRCGGRRVRNGRRRRRRVQTDRRSALQARTRVRHRPRAAVLHGGDRRGCLHSLLRHCVFARARSGQSGTDRRERVRGRDHGLRDRRRAPEQSGVRVASAPLDGSRRRGTSGDGRLGDRVISARRIPDSSNRLVPPARKPGSTPRAAAEGRSPGHSPAARRPSGRGRARRGRARPTPRSRTTARRRSCSRA
jgi:hypothetical protein